MDLCENNITYLPRDIGRPGYSRKGVSEGIVHLGLGAFHRAHEAAYTDAALFAGDRGWGILGAGLQSDDKKRALSPQDCLYALCERDGSGERIRVIGSLVRALGGRDDLGTLLRAMACPATRIVSLTITEKGYCLDSGTGELRMDAEGIAADLADPRAPGTAVGLIAEALRLRRAAGIPAFTVLSCDNLPANGARARAATVAYAKVLDPELAEWIASGVSFPSSMVDRITPATTDGDRERVAARLGMRDAWPVITEPYTQWVLEDDFPMGRPRWEIAGAVFTRDIGIWERLKLRCLNGAHSTLAYLGQLRGAETVADAMNDRFIRGAIRAFWADILPVAPAPEGVDTGKYVDGLEARFANPALRHRTEQIATDGSQKLPQRILAPWKDRIDAGFRSSPGIATAVAAWALYVARRVSSGAALADPYSGELARLAKGCGTRAETVDALLSFQAVFGNDAEILGIMRREVAQAMETVLDSSG